MRHFIVLIIWLLPLIAMAQEWEDRQVFEGTSARQTLRIISSTDTSFFLQVIESFLAETPEAAVEYLVTGTADLDKTFRKNPDQFDLVISSAMDLQFKLANDGYAARIEGMSHPKWAQWRQSLFAFTTEPAAIVINRAAFAGQPIPQTRQELIQALRADPDRFSGKVGTYDVRQSGLGYLFATQDARTSETYWRLMEVMGGLGMRLYCCSGDMIDDLVNGTITVAYNVLGSYASARSDTAGVVEIILPSDFPTTMMRTALVSKDASNPKIAIAFIRYLIDLQSSTRNHDRFPLPPLDAVQSAAGQSAIGLGPALMTYLDKLKRRTFIREWESAVIQRQ
ncbi:MAG: ABC transporter substrate-binding protein [Geminicoccales bacterium]